MDTFVASRVSLGTAALTCCKAAVPCEYAQSTGGTIVGMRCTLGKLPPSTRHVLIASAGPNQWKGRRDRLLTFVIVVGQHILESSRAAATCVTPSTVHEPGCALSKDGYQYSPPVIWLLEHFGLDPLVEPSMTCKASGHPLIRFAGDCVR